MTVPKHRKAISIPLLLETRRRRRNRKANSFEAKSRKLGIALGLLSSVVMMLSILFLAINFSVISSDLPSLEQIPVLLDPETGILSQPTQFYDREGREVLFTLENPGAIRRFLHIDPSEPENFSPQLIQVVVGLIEPDFWSSPGFTWRNLTDPEPHTFAERLTDSLLLQAEPVGLQRALRMRLIAAQLVASYGRTQVLEWFLNSAYFGHLAYGADQAAFLYFDKSASEINLAEAALLASLLSTPSLNPLDAPQAALERADAVLEELAGTGLFASQEISEARAADLAFTQPDPHAEKMDFFIQYALQQIEPQLDLRQIERGGLRVITTLDARLLEQLQCTVQTQLQRLGQPDQATNFSISPECSAALLLPTLRPDIAFSADSLSEAVNALRANALILDPSSSEILAWLGEQTVSGPVNTPSQYHAGSLLTPFVAATAFTRGFSPASLVWDVPQTDPSATPEGSALTPQNPDYPYRGPIHLRDALANDTLVPIVKLAETIGFENVWLLSQTLGLQSLEREAFQYNLINGDAPVTLPEIGQAYSTFANSGIQSGLSSGENHSLQLLSVLRVEDLFGNALIGQEEPQTRSLLSSGLAYLVHDVLSDSIARRPSLGHPNALEIGRPAGAKIGQVDGGKQVWTVGYTPQHLAVVWMGISENDRSHTTLKLQPEMAAGIWHAMMQYMSQDQSPQDWQQPVDVIQRTVCSPSGQLLTAACPLRVTDLFLTGSEPVVADTLYKTYYINRETGKLATIFTPLGLVEEKTFLMPPPQYQDWVLSSGLPQPPSDYDLIQAPDPPPGVEIAEPAPFSYVREKVSIIGSASGADFVAYRLQVGQGLNPRTWVQIGEESGEALLRGTLGVWDTSGLDGLYVIRLTVLRTQNRLETHVVQVSVDNTPPVVSITYPQQGQVFEYRPGTKILFLADALDAIGAEKIIWYLDKKQVAESNQPPYYMQWEMTAGEHTLQVQAFDLAGNESRSQEITLSVSNP